MDKFDEQEPTEEELKEIQRMIEEDMEEEIDGLINNRVYYQYTSFSSFLAWLRKNGIKW